MSKWHYEQWCWWNTDPSFCFCKIILSDLTRYWKDAQVLWLDDQSIRKIVQREHPLGGLSFSTWSSTVAPACELGVERKVTWIKDIHRLTGKASDLGTWKKQDYKVEVKRSRKEHMSGSVGGLGFYLICPPESTITEEALNRQGTGWLSQQLPQPPQFLSNGLRKEKPWWQRGRSACTQLHGFPFIKLTVA